MIIWLDEVVIRFALGLGIILLLKLVAIGLATTLGLVLLEVVGVLVTFCAFVVSEFWRFFFLIAPSLKARWW